MKSNQTLWLRKLYNVERANLTKKLNAFSGGKDGSIFKEVGDIIYSMIFDFGDKNMLASRKQEIMKKFGCQNSKKLVDCFDDLTLRRLCITFFLISNDLSYDMPKQKLLQKAAVAAADSKSLAACLMCEKCKTNETYFAPGNYFFDLCNAKLKKMFGCYASKMLAHFNNYFYLSSQGCLIDEFDLNLKLRRTTDMLATKYQTLYALLDENCGIGILQGKDYLKNLAIKIRVICQNKHGFWPECDLLDCKLNQNLNK